MEAQEIIDLSINARMNHWPPHLGVKTDAEKIEYLATKLDEAATHQTDTLADENTALREERDDFERKYDEARTKLNRLKDLVAQL